MKKNGDFTHGDIPVSVLLSSLQGEEILFHFLSYFPSQGAGTEDGSIALLKIGKHQLYLVLENIEQVLLHAFTDGVHNQVTCLSQTTKENDCLEIGRASCREGV